jgi:hypothetical protein
VNRALWLLLGLQCRGWLRSIRRSLGTVKGALLALLGLLVFGIWLLSLFLAEAGGAADPDELRRYGPAAVLSYCLFAVLFSRGERALYFSPAEVNLLFPGPFTRRQLLGYKVTVSALIILPTALFLALAVRVYARWFLAAFLGLFLGFLFLQLFLMAINLVATTVGARAYTRGRKLVLFAVVAVGAALLFQANRTAGPAVGRGLFGQLERTRLWQTVAAPLRWFVEVFLVGPYDWGELLRYTGLSLVLIVALLGLVLLLDAQYLESAAAASERIYARLQRMRRGEAGGMGWRGGGGKARLGLPDFPWWGGVGPVAWRQATTAMRGLGRLALFALILGPILVGPLLAGKDQTGTHLPAAVATTLLWLTVILTTLVPYDFRGDLERMEVLKSLPISAWRLAVGQLLTPVLLVSLVQWLFLGAIQAFWQRWEPLLLLCAAFAVPANLLVFGLDNLLFLWFPSRIVAANPGDFQALGRNVLVLLTKMLVLLVAGGLSAVVLLLVSWLSGSDAAGALSAWLTLSAFAAALVPLVALAFDRFDVARDMPA